MAFLQVFVACVVVCLAARAALCYEGWIGTITYRDSGMRAFQYERSNMQVSCEEPKEFKVAIRACFADDSQRLVDARADVTLLHTYKNTADCSVGAEMCCGNSRAYHATSEERKDGCDRVTPGPSSKASWDFSETIAGEVKLDDVGLSIYDDGRYRVGARGEVPVEHERRSTSFANEVCSGEEKMNSDSETTLRTETFGFTAEARWSGDVITGQSVLNEINETPDTPGCILASCYDPFAPTGFSSGDRRMIHSEWRVQTIAKWHFAKSPCFGAIKRAKGDVSIRAPSTPGEAGAGDQIGPAPEGPPTGCVTNLDGAVITTGRKSAAVLDMGNYRLGLGSNSRWEFGSDPCQTAPVERTAGQHIKGVLLIVGSTMGNWGHPVVIQMATCPSGVIGELGPLPREDREAVEYASLRAPPGPLSARGGEYPAAARYARLPLADQRADHGLPNDREAPWVDEEIDEIGTDPDELADADIAVLVRSEPEQYLYVEVLKGSVTLSDSSGARRDLDAGEVFSKIYPPFPRPSDFKTVFLIMGGR